jgi:subtilisin family serine protease
MSLGFDFPSMVARLIELDYPLPIAVSRALASYRATIGAFDDYAKSIEARGNAILIAASGNGSLRRKDPDFTASVAPPAASVGFIAVGAVSLIADTASSYAVSAFSNAGCRLVAPGERILSARPGDGLRTLSGTSMAAPHVAGVAALWLQRLFPNERPQHWVDDVRRQLEESALRIPGERQDVGLGLVQAPPTGSHN